MESKNVQQITTSILAGSFLIAAAILVGPIGNLKKSTTAQKSEKAQEETTTPTVTIRNDDYIRGDKNAPIKIVEYSDLECPFCKTFHQTLNAVLPERPDVALVYRHFPLDSLHAQARQEAEAAECVGSLGGEIAFWNFIDTVFTNTKSNDGLDLTKLPVYAETAGVNRQAFMECLNKKTFADKVQSQYDEATALGARGTPYSVIITPKGSQLPIPGYVDAGTLRKMLDKISTEKL